MRVSYEDNPAPILSLVNDHMILLTDVKRSTDQETIDMFIKCRKRIFYDPPYPTSIPVPFTRINLCYTNKTREKVNAIVNDQMRVRFGSSSKVHMTYKCGEDDVDIDLILCSHT